MFLSLPKKMETSHHHHQHNSSAGPKLERKVIEKNRRELQKGLFAQLHSLILPPSHHMEEVTMSLPDQIGEAVKYVKRLKMKVEKMKEKKEYYLSRTSSTTSPSYPANGSSFDVVHNNDVGISDNHNQPTTPSSRAETRPAKIEIQDMGPLMDTIVVTGLDNVATFYDIIHLLQQEQSLDVFSANFALHGNSVIQIMHKMGKEISGFGGETLFRKLENLVCGSSSSSSCDNYLLEMQQLPFWEVDEQFDSILWGFQPIQYGDTIGDFYRNM